MGKKGNAIVVGIVVILIIIILLVSWGQRGCSNNGDCAKDSYCGSDNECHAYPEQIVVRETNFVPASIIISGAIITAAIIYRKRSR